MRQECIIYTAGPNDFTPKEPWTPKRQPGHHYSLQADFALAGLGKGPGKCLVIGSPLFEAIELSQAGWDVTYVDVREPDGDYPFVFVRGDASKMDFGTESFDAVSTTCVLCHAGMGRYGDPVVEDADEFILMSIFKALKKGGRAAVTFGPVSNTSMPMRLGNVHRIYNLKTARTLTLFFKVLEERILDADRCQWISEFEHAEIFGRDYLSMLLEKP